MLAQSLVDEECTSLFLCLSVFEVQFDGYFVGKLSLYLRRRVLRNLLGQASQLRGCCSLDLVRKYGEVSGKFSES